MFMFRKIRRKLNFAHVGIVCMCVCACVYIYIYTQGESGGICNTLENDIMRDSKQKSSYEHGSDFEHLPRYCKKKIQNILQARTAITY